MQDESQIVRARRVQLGPIDAPELIFGTEFIVDRSPAQGGKLLADAAEELGLTFWDTAPPYGSHPHVREGLRLVQRSAVQVASKTRTESAEDAPEELAQLVQDLDAGYLDVGFIHYVKPGTWEQRIGVLPGFVRARDDGVIRAIGLSTHSPVIVRQASAVPEIDIICATYNAQGLWFDEGTPDEMSDAVDTARAAGKGVYLIKLLAHGQISGSRERIEAALRDGYAVRGAHAFNIGMADLDQARHNLRVLREVRP